LAEPADESGNLVGSLTNHGRHMPALDIDFPARLIPSKTPGHYHLYLDIPLSYMQYLKLVDTLTEVGILAEGNRMQMVLTGQTFLRTRPEEKVPFASNSDAIVSLTSIPTKYPPPLGLHDSF
jgi:hypothetical protein